MKTITRMFEVMLSKPATPTWSAGGPTQAWSWGGAPEQAWSWGGAPEQAWSWGG